MKHANSFPMMPSHTNPKDVDAYFMGLSKLELISAMMLQGILSGVSGKEELASVHPASWAESAIDAAESLIQCLERRKQLEAKNDPT